MYVCVHVICDVIIDNTHTYMYVTRDITIANTHIYGICDIITKHTHTQYGLENMHQYFQWFPVT